MRRLQHFSFTATEMAPRTPALPAKAAAAPQPRDEMWRSRRVLSGSDWMEAWVRKPGPR
ncbi:hypothetical protein [Pelomonas cellulosilytica]|uniref:Uncharacterized protein n=1 Tax=Pelomonas cellulosilytica TaxID=2906762 RepID=A0ABS8XXJ3_9BURK|nr:hypothetical protein [Pelomonas sp. P8]MCE4555434.1 hypothetical protein [Pelomonas sp. P8]